MGVPELNEGIDVNRIDEIRQRCGHDYYGWHSGDIKTLLAEVDRLTEDNERLTGISNNSDMPKYLDAVARMHAAEAQAVVAEAAIQRATALIGAWPDGNERVSDYAAARGQCKRAVAAALSGEEEA